MFTYKNRTSQEMFLKVEGDLTFTAPSRDIEFIEVQGRDGDLPLDNGRYQSVIRSFPCRLILPPGQNIEMATTVIHDWLSTDVNYHDFIWSGDSDFTYRAMVHEEYDIQRILNQYGRAIFKFRFHPIKYLTTSLEEVEVTNGKVINNPFKIAAKPLITVIGSGNITIKVGSSNLILEEIEEGVIVDSESQTVTNLSGSLTQFDKMFSYPFPTLENGNNVITWEENEETPFEIKIIPRLGALI